MGNEARQRERESGRSDNSLRLTPASPPDNIILTGKSRPASPWWLDDRLLNIVAGFIMAVAICLIPDFVKDPHTNKVLFYGVPLAVSSSIVLAVLFAKRRLGGAKDFDVHMGWMIVGMVAGAVMVWPLATTPECGWNNDKCVVTNHVRHRVK